ncbi:hypothetical protein WJX72_009019 [[Myrmecia] bisecta]|uniref:Serine aminopeptidase S33 domain-containing protein n=1 Tax=[Myrmecia] bisecta TaxID=41462 RepID=A0AAW1QFX1_9CHLO
MDTVLSYLGFSNRDMFSRWAVRLLYAGTSIVGLGLAALWALQEKLIYLPRLPGIPNDFPYLPDSFGLDYEDVELKAEDGTQLHGWFMWPRTWTAEDKKQRPVVLFFQENAGNMAFRLPFLRMLVRFLDCSVFAPSYRGYGLSKGKPTEAGLKQDAQASLDYLLQHPHINAKKIAVFGRSLGGAVAIQLLAANPHAAQALIIENTFTSIQDLAPKVMPMLRPFLGPGRPFNFLIRNNWNSFVELPKLAHLPIMMISSAQDELCPPEQMERLHGAVKAAGHCTWLSVDAHHMDAYEVAGPEYWPALIHFMQSQGLCNASQ